MRKLPSLLAGLLLAGAALHAIDIINSDNLLEFTGETTPNGSINVSVVDAPGKPGLKTLKCVFRKTNDAMDWLDLTENLTPSEDWSKETYITLPYYAVTPDIPIWIKVTGDNVPGLNSAVVEHRITIDDTKEGPLPAAGQWHELKIALPTNPAYKRSVNRSSFYMPMSMKEIPAGKEYVFYLGLGKIKLKPRVAWPPKGTAKLSQTTLVWSGNLKQGAPWLMETGRNNQNDHTAVFDNNAIAFTSTVEGWNEFAWSEPSICLKAETSYRLDFDFTVTTNLDGPNATFYSLIRTAATIQEDVGWQRWICPAGTTGHRTVIFKTRQHDDYRVIFGVRDKGGIRISNIRIVEINK